MTPAMESAVSTRAAKALAGGGVFPRDVRAPQPESSAAHLADWNDLTKSVYLILDCRFMISECVLPPPRPGRRDSGHHFTDRGRGRG
jgi:hypothetical protein